jgi:hypothetical protein
VEEAVRTSGLQVLTFNASTSREIEAAFAILAGERPDALFVAGDGFFNSRRVQFATLATHHRIPAAYAGLLEFLVANFGQCVDDALNICKKGRGKLAPGARCNPFPCAPARDTLPA